MLKTEIHKATNEDPGKRNQNTIKKGLRIWNVETKESIKNKQIVYNNFLTNTTQ